MGEPVNGDERDDPFPVYQQGEYAAAWQVAHGFRCRTDARAYKLYRGQLKSWMIRNRGLSCEDCGVTFTTEHSARSALVVHHVMPVAEGGKDEPDNLVLICGECHQGRHPFKLSSKAAPAYSMDVVSSPGSFRGVDLTTMSDDEAMAAAFPSEEEKSARKAKRAADLAEQRAFASDAKQRRLAALKRWRDANGWRPRAKRSPAAGPSAPA